MRALQKSLSGMALSALAMLSISVTSSKAAEPAANISQSAPAQSSPGWQLLLPAEFNRQLTDSPLAVNYRSDSGMLINLTFYVDDEWREASVNGMLDEFMQGLLAVPGVNSGKQFTVKQPLTVKIDADKHPQPLTFLCQDWHGPGVSGLQIGRLCLAQVLDLKVLMTLSAPTTQAKVAAEHFQLALLSLRYNWDALVALRDSQL
jgi:hypothetical protein